MSRGLTEVMKMSVLSHTVCHPELVSGSTDPATFEILKRVQNDRLAGGNGNEFYLEMR